VASYEHVFTPIKIGRLTVKNRIEAAPAMPILASICGDATQELIEWERALAKGGAGIVTRDFPAPLYHQRCQCLSRQRVQKGMDDSGGYN
jgi:2,4-dienoyl-CoA reductase-like NADH-dependent reductase (Old Yellow Enzyme family)